MAEITREELDARFAKVETDIRAAREHTDHREDKIFIRIAILTVACFAAFQLLLGLLAWFSFDQFVAASARDHLKQSMRAAVSAYLDENKESVGELARESATNAKAIGEHLKSAAEDAEELRRLTEDATSALAGRAFGEIRKMSVGEWHRAESDGFLILSSGGNNPAGGKMMAVTGKPDKKVSDLWSGHQRTQAVGTNSDMILVLRGQYFGAARLKADPKASDPTLLWAPLLAARSADGTPP